MGPFSMFGYLDLKADTQWIRVTPIRQTLLPDPAPIDAVVTLEHLGTGRVVTLRDSLFTFADPRLDTVGYAHNFWTTEPIEPEATYRLKAVRSDGAATTALVEPFIDMFRREVQIAVARSDWPYEPGLSATEVAIPGIISTTVENGVGSVVGVARWTIPLPFCEALETRPDGSQPCTAPQHITILLRVKRLARTMNRTRMELAIG